MASNRSSSRRESRTQAPHGIDEDVATQRPLVHLISGLAAGGTESFLLRLLAANADLRAASQVISVRRNDDLSDSFRQLGIPVRFFPVEGRLSSVLNLVRLVRALAAPGVRLVQSWLYLSDALASLLARAICRKPVVWGIRSSHGGEGRTATRFIARRLNPWLSSRCVDAIVVCGEQARAAHAGFGYDQSRMVVIPNGFELKRFARDEAGANRIRKDLGLGTEDFAVGMVARASIYKDHATLFDAIAHLRQEIPRIHIVLCGNGMDLDNSALAAQIDQHGLADCVHLLGMRRDLPAVYSALDLHVLSSRSEGFPNVVAESMLCGCGSISAHVGEAAEIIPDERWLVPPGSVMALASAIAAYHGMDARARADLLRRNAAWVQQHFSIDTTAAAYLALYRSLAPLGLETLA